MRNGQFFPLQDINPNHRFPILTISLIIANIGAYIWEVMSGPERTIMEWGFKPAMPSIITALTSMFLHGGIDHIFGNMWFLWIFGDNIESRLREIKYILLYFASGLAATALHYVLNMGSSIPAVGASGAISGILGAYVVLFPNVQIVTASRYGRSKMPAFMMIGLWFLIQLVFATTSFLGYSGSNIAFGAHVGGFIAGAALALVLKGGKVEQRK